MKQILFNPLLMLSNVNRYSGVYLAKAESTSDHTCQVGLMALLATNELNNRLREHNSTISTPLELVNLETVAFKALIHDIDEASSADIPRNVKYATEEIREQFAKLEREAGLKVETDYNFQGLFESWQSSKDASIEGRIVKLCDLLTVVRKTVEEVSILGNKNMLRVAVDVMEQVKSEKKKIRLDNTMEYVIKCFFIEMYDTAIPILQTIIERNLSTVTDFYFQL